MDVAVLLLFAAFFTALVMATTSRHDVLRLSIRRPRAFQLAAVGAAAVTVPVDPAGSAGSALAIYSLLVCVISASSLFRRRVRSAIDPQEG